MIYEISKNSPVTVSISIHILRATSGADEVQRVSVSRKLHGISLFRSINVIYNFFLPNLTQLYTYTTFILES